VVERGRSGEFAEGGRLGDILNIFYPFVTVADLEEQAETESVLDAQVDLALGVLAHQTAFGHEGVHELHLGQLVVAVDGVLRGCLQPEPLQLLLETFVLALGKVLVDLRSILSIAVSHLVLEFGGSRGVLVHAPGA